MACTSLIRCVGFLSFVSVPKVSHGTRGRRRDFIVMVIVVAMAILNTAIHVVVHWYVQCFAFLFGFLSSA